jgi:transcriptional regulator with XRE-family HTH domain/tetratricopeptide (TPR) repeat protein
MTGDSRAFGARLHAVRQSAGLSQQELAERSGLSIRTISNLEHGRTRWPFPASVQRLADALGLEDGMRRDFLAAASRRLAGASAPSVTRVPEDRLPQGGSGQAVPRQLPASVRQFAGRRAELNAISGLLDHTGISKPAVVISAVEGTAGVGKTALAVYWAHQVAGRFPDGQLYVNLRGYDPSGKLVPSAEALRGFLDAMGVPAERIPASLDRQASLYRSLLSGKRVLVVLDNARDAEQVRPLLPGSPGCMALVTSRGRLTGLVAAEGAYALTLGLLSEAEARELLALRLGAAQLDAEPEAAAELIVLCARLPLALAIGAARASGGHGLGLGALAAELKDARRRLDALDTSDAMASVRAVFSWSLDGLPAPAARMFGLLSVHAGPDITAPAAASLAGVSLAAARAELQELAAGHLLTEHLEGRFAFHDLLRAYATEQATITEDEAGLHAARSRVLDHYLHTAHAAAVLLNPSREPVTLPPARPDVIPEHLADHRQALAWFEAERCVLLSAVALAASTGSGTHAWQLPWTMTDFLDWRGYWHDWAAIQRTALEAATRLGDTVGQAAARRLLAQSCARLGDYDQARAHLNHCLDLCRQLGDQAGEARTYQTLCWVADHQHRYTDALGCAEQALALFRAVGDQAGQAHALNNVGYCQLMLGDRQQARAFCLQALALHRELGIRHGQAVASDSLGYAEHQLGHLTEAATRHRQALSLFRELGNRLSEAESLMNLGDTWHAAGNSSAAIAAWQQAVAILDELRHHSARQVRIKLLNAGGI